MTQIRHPRPNQRALAVRVMAAAARHRGPITQTEAGTEHAADAGEGAGTAGDTARMRWEFRRETGRKRT